MTKFKIGFKEVIEKRYEVEVEAPEGTTWDEMDSLCSGLEDNTAADEVINELKAKGFEVTEVIEGAESGELDIDELEEC